MEKTKAQEVPFKKEKVELNPPRGMYIVKPEPVGQKKQSLIIAPDSIKTAEDALNLYEQDPKRFVIIAAGPGFKDYDPQYKKGQKVIIADPERALLPILANSEVVGLVREADIVSGITFK